MPPEPERLGLEARRLRLNTLIGLRWLAVVGQTAAVLIGVFVFGLGLPAFACFALIAASAALNLALRWLYPVSAQVSERAATIVLAYDILQLSGLLFLTGGVANPFVMLFSRPLPSRPPRFRLGARSGCSRSHSFCVTALLRFNLPLPWIGGERLVLPPLYVAGVWVSLVVSAAFVVLYAYRVAAEARHTASALTAAELVLASAQHLSQLDGLAAAAAHELGTPLATVALVVREMAAQKPPDEAFADDLSLLEESVDRCRAILGKLSAPADMTGQTMDVSSPVELAELAAAPHRPLGVSIAVAGEGPEPPPKCSRNPGVLYGVGNLIENARQFRPVGGDDPGRLDENDRHDRHFRRRTRVSAQRAVEDRRAVPVASGRRPAGPRRPAAGSALGSSSPGRFSSAPRATLRFANAEPPSTGAVVTVAMAPGGVRGGST